MNSFFEYLKSIYYWNKVKIKYLFNKNDLKFSCKAYEKYHHRKLDVNNPIHIDERISLNKFKCESYYIKSMTDKDSAREHIANLGLSNILIQPYYSYNNVSEIDFSKFEEPVIIKNNHISGTAYKYYPGDKINKWKLRTLNFLMKQNYYKANREKNYDNMNKKIIVEKLLKPEEGILLDYKFFCFNGKIGFVFIDQGISKENGSHDDTYKRNIVDENFKQIDRLKEKRDSIDMSKLKKPINWEKMCEYAKIISKEFNFIRVDLYNVDGQIYFGETTFFHGAGFNDFEPEDLDIEIAKHINLL